MSNLVAKEYKCFEDIKKVRADGSEYWCARDLAVVLDYTKWENFHKVIKRAMIACKNSGRIVEYDFPEVRKIVAAGATTKPKLDYELTRYACYLIVQNGDPRKEVIALGQTYFAIQTYRQEVADHFNELDEDSRRLVVRGDIKQWNQLLAETARNSGVITNEERPCSSAVNRMYKSNIQRYITHLFQGRDKNRNTDVKKYNIII